MGLSVLLHGLTAGIIDRTQFSLLIGVVMLSAIVPTAVAQRLIGYTNIAARPDANAFAALIAAESDADAATTMV